MIEAIGRAIVRLGHAVQAYGFERWRAAQEKKLGPCRGHELECDGGVSDDELIEPCYKDGPYILKDHPMSADDPYIGTTKERR